MGPLSTIRTVTASAALLAMSVVDATAPAPASDAELVRYAITQGGLLAVVLVLLWSYRRDTLSVLKEQENRLQILTDLVSSATEALTKSADATDRMARAVEQLR